MSKQTAWRRLQSDTVRELVNEVRAARRSSVMEWANSVRSLADLVTDAVVGVLDDEPSHSTVARLTATLLPEVRHLTETVELGERLEVLEAQLSGGRPDELARVVAIQ